MKVHKGDTVQVISGKDRGLKGRVLVAYPRLEKLLVEGANRVKKHTKVQPAGRGGQSGGIITQEAPIHVSNVMVVCPSCDKPVRVGYRVNAEGQKVRTCRGKDCEGDL